MFNRKTIAWAGALLLFLSTPEIGLAKGLSLKQVKSLLTDLGYEPTDRDASRISVDDQGRFKRDINFALNDDTTVLNIYAPLSEIPEEKRVAVPMEDLLKANDSTTPFAYAIVTVEGKERLDMEATFDTGTVNKQMLRRTIDALVAAMDAGEPLWGEDHWTVPAAAIAAAAPKTAEPPKTLEAAKADFFAAWEKAPLRIQHGMFVAESATSYGTYTRRPDNVFKPGETITAYMEPEGYVWKALDDDVKSTDISFDMLLSDKDGTVIADKTQFLSKSFKAHGNILGLFLNIDLNANGLPVGEYQVRYTMHDLNGDKSAEITLPFKVAG